MDVSFSFVPFSFHAFVSLALLCTVRMCEWHELRRGQPVIRPRASQLYSNTKKLGKNNILRGLCPTLCYYYCRGWQVRGRENPAWWRTRRRRRRMKLHLFWWLTNDFEMRAALARRQNDFPNNKEWSLNKQNWDAGLVWRRDLPSWDTCKPSGCVCVCVSMVLNFFFIFISF